MRKTILDETQNKVVYDFGCVGDVGQVEKAGSGIADAVPYYFGFDNNREGIALLRAKGYHVSYYDFSGPLDFIPEESAQRMDGVVLMAEIIEHLPNPGQALMDLRGLARFHPSLLLLITTPNLYSLPMTIGYWLTGKDLDSEEHVMRFSMKNMKLLLEKSGWRVVEQMFYFHDDHTVCETMDRGTKLYFAARSAVYRSFPRGAPGFFTYARPV